MTKNENMHALEEDVLDTVSGGAAAPGSVMMCTMEATLYEANPTGGQFRSEPKIKGTVTAGTPVKIYEHGTRYSRVIANGVIGWIENSCLKNTVSL